MKKANAMKRLSIDEQEATVSRLMRYVNQYGISDWKEFYQTHMDFYAEHRKWASAPFDGMTDIGIISEMAGVNVPDYADDIPSKARARGFRKCGIKTMRRQDDPFVSWFLLPDKIENVRFTESVSAGFRWIWIPPQALQPSHLDGKRNPYFFIDEAQPKDRTDDVSRQTAEKYAADFNTSEVLEHATAYSGAPIINGRGEVIQGNGRAAALKILFEKYPEKAKEYYEAATEFEKKKTKRRKFTTHPWASWLYPHDKEVNKNNPYILVRLLLIPRKAEDGSTYYDIPTDEESISYGQYTDTQVTTGGRQVPSPNAIASHLSSHPQKMRAFHATLFKDVDEDDTMSDIIEARGVDVLQELNNWKFITPSQFQSCIKTFNGDTRLNADGRDAIRGTLHSLLFHDAPADLAKKFEFIPVKAQSAILAIMCEDFKQPTAKRLIYDIRDAIALCYKLTCDKQNPYNRAKSYEQAWDAVRMWAKQTYMDERTLEARAHADDHTPQAMKMAAMFKGCTQNQIKNIFMEIYDKMKGAGGRLWDTNFGRELDVADAMSEVLEVEYQERPELGKVTF